MSNYVVKFNQIDNTDTWATNARSGLYLLLKNGYIKIGAYFEIEVNKIIKCLKVLGIKHEIKFISPTGIQNDVGNYEFTLDFFVDDRKGA
jgi:hypothetical protein